MGWQYPEPMHPCRVMPTRRCPDVYNDVCGDRPCARFESDDETPWLRACEFCWHDWHGCVPCPEPSTRRPDGQPCGCVEL